MLSKVYDVFIAYHGSFERDGSRPIAEKIYKYLEHNGLNCFYFPYDKDDSYKANLVEAVRSRTLLFICSNSLQTTQNGVLDRKFHYDLHAELDVFYGLTQMEDDVQAKDAKVVVVGNKWAKGEEERLHPLFMGRTHIFFNNDASCLAEIRDWVLDRLAEQKEKFNAIDSSDIFKTYMTRSEMMVDIDYKRCMERAKKVSAIGISNTELMRNEYSVFGKILEKGGEINIAFLQPEGRFTQIREIEEKVKKGRIADTTNYNMQIARDIYDELTNDTRSRFHVYTYDRAPRINLIILDDIALLQYYDSFNRGMYNPSFVIKKNVNGRLFKYCEEKIAEILGVSKEITW